MMDLSEVRLAVIGLGYVGLPLAVAFSQRHPVIGFDISASRIAELRAGVDSTLEVSEESLASAAALRFSSDVDDLRSSNVFLVTVPTPIDAARRPDFDPLLRASEMVGGLLKPGDVVVYESTVYPGVTEEVCVPVLEKVSGLAFNADFFCGYSPERINPGDSERTVTKIVKVTSGSTPEVAEFVDRMYAQVIEAGTHKAPSIRVAEAAKVIENTQRDVNIALMNELARIFNRIGINTQDVLSAAATKWNFIPFSPGLVGGHCIGVDPYYLAHKATMLGYNAELILAARRINDEMGGYVAGRVIRQMAKAKVHVVDSRILVLGLAFKENCPDLRNTKVVDVIDQLREANACVDVYDPWVDAESARLEYGIEMIDKPVAGSYDAVVLAVPHREFMVDDGAEVLSFIGPAGVVFDVKGRLAAADNIFQL